MNTKREIVLNLISTDAFNQVESLRKDCIAIETELADVRADLVECNRIIALQADCLAKVKENALPIAVFASGQYNTWKHTNKKEKKISWLEALAFFREFVSN